MKKVLPAEWEEQEAIIIAWPNENSDWKENLAEVENIYVEIVNQIIDHQMVVILSKENYIKEKFSEQSLDKIRIILVDYNDTWTRDYIGLSIKSNKEFCLINFRFNGWGNKYACEKDNLINLHLYKKNIFTKVDFKYNNFTLEGGSIDSDGRGTILATSECLLNKNRNPNLTKNDIEIILLQSLGVKKILWINHGHIPGDDTDAHIDNLARFCSENKIVYASNNSSEMKLMEQELIKIALEHKYELIPIPLPKPIFYKGERLPASYINFTLTNKKVLVPTFGDTNDNNAISILKNAFPNRKVFGINCKEIIKQKGALHCLTMHLNKNILNRSVLQ